MKKNLFLISLFLMFLIPHNVFAYDIELNGETVAIDNENYIYYFYSNYTDIFEQYSYFMGATTSSGGYYVALFNSTNIGFSSPFVFPQYDTVGQFHRFYLNSSNGSTESKTYNKNTMVFEASQITYSNFDYKYGSKTFIANITKEDLEKYFSNSDSESELPPSDNPIVNDYFDSEIHNVSVSILGDDVPYEFDFIYIMFDFFIVLVVIFCVIAPFIILFKVMGVI